MMSREQQTYKFPFSIILSLLLMHLAHIQYIQYLEFLL